MTKNPRRKSDAARRANQVIRGRTMLVMVLLGVATFTVLFMKLYDLQINQYDTLHARAVGQQTDSSVISASRGTIYDKNGEIMAISYSAETVYVDPHQIQLFVESQQEDIQAAASQAVVSSRNVSSRASCRQSPDVTRTEPLDSNVCFIRVTTSKGVTLRFLDSK